ncbi:hypothetical protein K469DRAFT_364418 [Zopfia rhizophila CBS 207.26]|uniref:Uncharacterized protein n=1 Tax=Zopfia rhizophila CBS 207.26 TaxID=1314779 RepID=A0A6A6EMD7_9PEZI|nr:hypothetical protein K469DRAFT_364418 [Zopfia rhizophila CBS 207.26]
MPITKHPKTPTNELLPLPSVAYLSRPARKACLSSVQVFSATSPAPHVPSAPFPTPPCLPTTQNPPQPPLRCSLPCLRRRALRTTLPEDFPRYARISGYNLLLYSYNPYNHA